MIPNAVVYWAAVLSSRLHCVQLCHHRSENRIPKVPLWNIPPNLGKSATIFRDARSASHRVTVEFHTRVNKPHLGIGRSHPKSSLHEYEPLDNPLLHNSTFE